MSKLSDKKFDVEVSFEHVDNVGTLKVSVVELPSKPFADFVLTYHDLTEDTVKPLAEACGDFVGKKENLTYHELHEFEEKAMGALLNLGHHHKKTHA